MAEGVTISDFPNPPEGSPFRLREVKKISIPHPYGIKAAHVVVASDKFGGRLGEEAIKYAERQGITCFICQGQYKFEDHTNDLTLVIEVDSGQHNLNSLPGLKEYLLSIKMRAEELGVKGFAFPKPGQVV